MSAVANINGTMATSPVQPTAAMVRHTSGVEPSTMAELKDFAVMAAASRFFGASTPEQALIIAMAGKDLGFTYTQALRAFYVVKGKPSLSADGMIAVCLARPDLCEYFRPVEVTETKAIWETKRVGSPPVRYEFTEADAKKAGIWGEMYIKHPKRMLSARAKSYLARDTYAELLMGLVTEDEAHEIAAARDPGPRAVEVAHVVELDATPFDIDAFLQDIAAVKNHDEVLAIAARIRKLKGDPRVSEKQAKLIGARYREIKERMAPPKAKPAEPAEPVQADIHDADFEDQDREGFM